MATLLTFTELLYYFPRDLDSYELEDVQLPRYIESMDKLAQHVLIYPNHRESINLGNRDHISSLLNDVARQYTHTPRPRTIPLSYLDHIPDDTILKRGYSSNRDHVLWPEDQDRDWVSMGLPESMREYWVSQEFNPLLGQEKFGQIRVFALSGRPCRYIRTVHDTRYSRGVRSEARKFAPLDLMRYVQLILFLSGASVSLYDISANAQKSTDSAIRTHPG